MHSQIITDAGCLFGWQGLSLTEGSGVTTVCILAAFEKPGVVALAAALAAVESWKRTN